MARRSRCTRRRRMAPSSCWRSQRRRRSLRGWCLRKPDQAAEQLQPRCPDRRWRMASILVCDDVRSICEMLEITLRKDGHRVETVTSGEAAKKKIESALFDVIVTDIRMPQINGIEVLRYAYSVSPDTLVILITAVDDMEAAVQAVKAGGAYDYIRKGPGLLEDV